MSNIKENDFISHIDYGDKVFKVINVVQNKIDSESMPEIEPTLIVEDNDGQSYIFYPDHCTKIE